MTTYTCELVAFHISMSSKSGKGKRRMAAIPVICASSAPRKERKQPCEGKHFFADLWNRSRERD